jgi:hypothetical protein
LWVYGTAVALILAMGGLVMERSPLTFDGLAAVMGP